MSPKGTVPKRLMAFIGVKLLKGFASKFHIIFT